MNEGWKVLGQTCVASVLCGRKRVSCLRRAVCQKETQNNTIEQMEWESVGGGRWKSEDKERAFEDASL